MSSIKKIVLAVLFTFLVSGLCIGIALTAYLNSLPNCAEALSNTRLPVYPLLLKIDKFDVTVTGKKRIGLGQTFIVEGDGRWYSNTTLIGINDEEAILLIEYYGEDSTEFCLWHASRMEFNR